MNIAVLRELKTYLEGRGVAPVFLLAMPASGADKCVVLKEYGDSAAPPWRVDGRLQVMTRSILNTPEEAKALAQQVHDILWPATQQTPAVAIRLATITVALEHLSGPFQLGPDAQGRWECSINYRVQLGRS